MAEGGEDYTSRKTMAMGIGNVCEGELADDETSLTDVNRLELSGLDQPGLSGLDQPGLSGLDQPGPSGLDQPGPSGLGQPGPSGLDQPGPSGLDQPGPSRYCRRTGVRERLMQDKTYNADVPLSSDEVQVSGSSSQDSLSPRKKMPRLESNLLKDANEESDEAEDTDAQSDWAYGGDTFLERSDSGLIRWYPEDPHSFLSDDSSHCDYQLMTHLYHTIHLDEFFKTQINQHFIMKDLVRGPNREKIKGFYLRTRSEEQPPHNKYGNCSYYIKFMSLVELCLENNIRQFYLLDACQSNNKCATRYLITDNTERFFKHQWAFDCRGYGGSWHAIPGPLWYEHKYARYIRGFRSNQDWPVLHELEFFVSIADALRDALFSRCKAKCEEHAESNNEDNCYRYRNGSAEDWLICPYPYSKQETLNELKRFVRTDGTLCRSFS